MSEWQTHLLRLTLFPTSLYAPSEAQSTWMQVVKSEPETVNLQPKAMRNSIQGDYALGRLQFEAHADRLDWLYIAPDHDAIVERLGAFDQALTTFGEITDAWFALEKCPSVYRMAFGAILFAPENDKNAAYDRLARYIPAVRLDKSASDLLYQINRPRDVETDGISILINRLAKWSVVAISQQEVVVTNDRLLRRNEILSVGPRIELDINTSPDFSGTLDPKQQHTLLATLVGFAKEIVAKGDVP